MKLLEILAPLLALAVFAIVFVQMFRSMKRQRSRDNVKDLANEIIRRELQDKLAEIDQRKRRMSAATCSGCGGNNAPDTVSPHGDVKCRYCGVWFNINDSDE